MGAALNGELCTKTHQLSIPIMSDSFDPEQDPPSCNETKISLYLDLVVLESLPKVKIEHDRERMLGQKEQM